MSDNVVTEKPTGNGGAKRRRLKEYIFRILLVAFSLFVALVLAEIVTRIVYPISDGRANVTLDGEKITAWREPGTVYRQISNEYDVLTTITDMGYRVPEVAGNPDIVFIGDSFTFGWGVADEDTFVSIYCGALQLACANLGDPGSGTARHVDNLERALVEWEWRPQRVKLFIFGMTASFSSGNDLADNYDYARWMMAQTNVQEEPREQKSPGVIERIIASQSFLLDNSNLVRIGKYHWGPLLRSTLVPELEAEKLEEALGYTRDELGRLNRLSEEYDFEYDLYLIHPVQDVMNGTYGDTLDAISAASPVEVVTTAELFLDVPGSYYFSYDGHLNAKGARKVGEFLIARHQEAKSR